MDHDLVHQLEEEIAEAIAGVLWRRRKPAELPWKASPRTVHLMAKAAVAVYEGAFEGLDHNPPQP